MNILTIGHNSAFMAIDYIRIFSEVIQLTLVELSVPEILYVFELAFFCNRHHHIYGGQSV